MLAGIKPGRIVLLPAKFYISTGIGNEVVSRNSLFATVEEHRIHNGMALPAVKAMPHRRAVTAGHGSDCHKAHPASAITFLQHGTQVSRKNVRFYERIAEVGDAHQTGVCGQLIQRAIERRHSAQGGVTVIFNAGHSAAASVHKGGLHFRGGGNRVSGSLTASGERRTSPSMSTRLST